MRERYPVDLTTVTQGKVVPVFGIASLNLGLAPTRTREETDLLMETRGTFCWRRDSLQRLAGLGDGANDLGRSWVVEADGSKREINGGDLITRAEAGRLAAAGKYPLDTDA